MKRYMYVAVRRDLSHGQQVVQSCHAAIEASKRYHLSRQEHPSVIVLGVKSEKGLDNFTKYVHDQGFHYEMFREPDRDNELTAVAVFPVSEDQKTMFKKFQLLR